VGLLHRFRDAVEHGWPRPIELEEYSHAALAAAIAAGAAQLPFGVLRANVATDLMTRSPWIASVANPFGDGSTTAVRAINPDVAIIHAQQADRHGNVALWGIVGLQKEAVLASKRAIVTVEEIRD